MRRFGGKVRASRFIAFIYAKVICIYVFFTQVNIYIYIRRMYTFV